MSGDWAEMGLANVSARVRELGETVEAVAARLPLLGDSVARLDDDVDRLLSERSDTGSALSRHDRELRELSATVTRLQTQVSWIEQHIRRSGAARAVDLDLGDPELAALAATVEKGRRATDELLTPFARAGLETTVADHRDAVARHSAAVRALLGAVERLIGAEREDAEHRRARSDYTSARSARADAARRLDAVAAEAGGAADRLAEDDDARRERAAVIAAGERAESELLTRLRTKVAAAVGDGALLPAWLTGPLGPMPPAGSTGRWVELAAGLLAYRLGYGVDDPDDALGELPDDAVGHRRRRHAELVQGLRDLRR